MLRQGHVVKHQATSVENSSSTRLPGSKNKRPTCHPLKSPTIHSQQIKANLTLAIVCSIRC